MANETVLVDLGPSQTRDRRAAAAAGAHLPRYELGPQALVQNVVASGRGPAPAPAVVEHDPSWVGAPFLVMPMVHGDIAGPAPVFDPYIMEASAAGAAAHARRPSSTHWWRSTPSAVGGVGPEGHLLPGAFGSTTPWRAGRPTWSGRRQGDPLPALAAALEWCGDRLPAERARVLLWGDVRLGNLVFDAGRSVTAVLDWDLASIGPPGDGSRVAFRAGAHDGVALRPLGIPGFPRAVRKRWRIMRRRPATPCGRGNCTGTRSSPSYARWPSTTATSASRVTGVEPGQPMGAVLLRALGRTPNSEAEAWHETPGPAVVLAPPTAPCAVSLCTLAHGGGILWPRGTD